jgi:hypothetical protein
MANFMQALAFVRDILNKDLRHSLRNVHAARASLHRQYGVWPAINVEIEDEQHNTVYRIVYDEGSLIPHIEPPLPAEPTE